MRCLALLVCVMVYCGLANAECDKVDALIILDGSGSINSTVHNKIKVHLKNFAKMKFEDISLNIAWMSFGGTAFVQWKFSVSQAYEDFWGAENLAKNDDISQVHLALEKANTELFTGAGVRADAKKVVIILTDGRADDQDATEDAAEALKDKGVLLITVGIGDVNEAELQKWASDDDCSFEAEETGKMNQICKDINKIIIGEFCKKVCIPPPGEVFFDMKSRYDSDGSANRFHFQCGLIGERATKEIVVFKLNEDGSEDQIAKLTPDAFETMDYVDDEVTAIDCTDNDDCEDGDSSFMWIVLNRYNHFYVDDSTPEFQEFGCRTTDEYDRVQEMTEVYRVREPDDTNVDATKKADNLYFKARPAFNFDSSFEYVSMRISILKLPLPTEMKVLSPDGRMLGRIFGASETERWEGTYRRLKVFGAVDCSVESLYSDECRPEELAFLRVDYHPTNPEDVVTDDYPYYHPKSVITFEDGEVQEQERYNRMAIVHPADD